MPLFRFNVSTFSHLRSLAIAVAAAVLLAGCAASDTQPELDLSEREYYLQAQTALDRRAFQEAIDVLRQLEARYPFGAYAQQSQLELIYAHFRNYEPELAASIAERFIRLHPQHPDVDYAYYMKGLANYDSDIGGLSRYLPQDPAKRDPGTARQAYLDFAALTRRHPQSPYAVDARQRMVHLRNRLARHEIHVARYYFKRNANLAALNRGRYVVENHPESPAVPDALAVMVHAYQRMDLPGLAEDSLRVLRASYPGHPSLEQNGFTFRLELEASGDQSVEEEAEPAPPPSFQTISSAMSHPDVIG